MHRRLIDAFHKLDATSESDEEKMAFISRAEDVLREEKVWQESQLRFRDQMKSRYCSWYPDMVLPLLSAASQVSFFMLLQLASCSRQGLGLYFGWPDFCWKCSYRSNMTAVVMVTTRGDIQLAMEKGA
jgi:hypothetical protein